jgi:hypothetical protein
MTSRRPRAEDPLELDADSIAFHQSITFDADVAGLSAALGRSPLFRLEPDPGTFRADWIRVHGEDDPLGFPLGRVTLWGTACALDAFTDDRLVQLRRVVEEAVHHELNPDESRIVPLEDALRRPRALWTPPSSPVSDESLTRAIALEIVRGVWTFLRRRELNERIPAALVRTERGRDAIEGILGSIPAAMRQVAPSFPALSIDALRVALLPSAGAPAPVSPPAPAPRDPPVPARRRIS